MSKSLKFDRGFIEQLILAVALPAVAGAVNSTGFLVVGAYTSHVSGTLSKFGDEMAQARPAAAWAAAMLALAFRVGAVASTVLVDSAKKLAKARFVSALLVESGALALFGALSAAPAPFSPGYKLLLTTLLSFTMGLQNALVTNISGAVVRTTHMTGVVTDIGIESVRALSWFRERLRDTGRLPLRALTRGPELRRLRIHLAIVTSFLVGAVVGPTMYLRAGPATIALPVILLLCLAGFDLALGIHGAGGAPGAKPLEKTS